MADVSEHGGLTALYFPFSRSIDPCSTKQMLLVFDSLNFLDPVDDDSWRAHLMREMEDANDPRFEQYRAIGSALPMLIREGAVVRRDPADLCCATNPLVSASALADLQDPSWTAIASNPAKYKMPHRRQGADGRASWEIFKPKLQQQYVDALANSRTLANHLFIGGDESRRWILSYSAGSAAALAMHLAAADELGLSPVTDSLMHHLLLLQKASRSRTSDSKNATQLPQEAVEAIASRTAIGLVGELLPRAALEAASFDEIMEFRVRTKDQRWQFTRELRRKLSVMSKSPTASGFEQAADDLRCSIAKELREYQAEVQAVQRKIWPTLVASVGTAMPVGSAAAIAATYLAGGPGVALSLAGVAAGVSFLKGLLDLRIDERRLRSKAAAPVSYLSQVRGNFGCS